MKLTKKFISNFSVKNKALELANSALFTGLSILFYENLLY